MIMIAIECLRYYRSVVGQIVIHLWKENFILLTLHVMFSLRSRIRHRFSMGFDADVAAADDFAGAIGRKRLQMLIIFHKNLLFYFVLSVFILLYFTFGS